ncbi:MAG: hypothetical protein PHR06_16110 [Candidatus Cloacimonetes bacterium]|nr:hypothetical protein [Candidatus Cloacimonadota bacterium]
MTGLKSIFCLVAGIMLIMAITAPVSADKIIGTSTKVFFEKNGQPYNKPVKYTLKCYGYIVDDTDPNRKNYWSGNYIRKEPGTFNQTEVFAYSATADHYGAEIFEPFYLNYRVIDYCTLYGETNGKKFIIENVGESPIPNCSLRKHGIDYSSYNHDSDICYLSTNESESCNREESKIQSENYDLCDKYIEKFDMKKLYPENTRAFERNGVMMVETEEYLACTEKAMSIDLNCDNYQKEVSCKNYCDPEGNSIQRDCSLDFTIPTDDAGNIKEISKEEEENFTAFSIENTGTTGKDSIFTIILKFLGLM